MVMTFAGASYGEMTLDGFASWHLKHSERFAKFATEHFGQDQSPARAAIIMVDSRGGGMVFERVVWERVGGMSGMKGIGDNVELVVEWDT